MRNQELINLDNYIASTKREKNDNIENIKNEISSLSQFRSGDNYTNKVFANYMPTKFNFSIMAFIRETFPIADNAIKKYKSLLGSHYIETGNEALDIEISDWADNVKVNYTERGLDTWIKQMVDSALEFGGGIGETVLNKVLNDIYKIRVDDVRKIRFSKNKQDDELLICQSDGFTSKPFNNQQLINYLGLDFRLGNPYGYPLFWGLPFVSQILSKIYNAINNQLIRIGDPIFFIALESGSNAKYADAKNSLDALKGSWDEVQKLKTRGKYGDVFTAAPPDSKWTVKAIGADLEIMDLEIPTRTMLEQFCNATDFPPFFLYLHFGDNYNITTHQADGIVNNIDLIRGRCTGALKNVYDIKFAMMRRAGIKYNLEWNPVNLRDEKNEAEVQKLNAETEKIEAETRMSLMENGIIDDQSFIKWAVDEGIQMNSENSLKLIYNKLEKNKYKNNLDYSTLKLIKKVFSGVNNGNDVTRISAGIFS